MQSENNCNNKVSLSVKLANLSLNELLIRDAFGRTILHTLVLSNRYDLLRSLFKNANVKHLINCLDYENGWNCLHYIFFYKRLACFRSLLDYLKGLGNSIQTNSFLVELMFSKDRNRQVPVQLLNNDFKDLVWVPQYIDEKNDIHLQYRYDDNKDESRVKRNSSNNLRHWWNEDRCGSDVCMFGSNANNNLGVGDSTDRSIPSKLPKDNFVKPRLHEIRIQDVFLSPRFKKTRISKNHSVIVTQEGELFTCGVGSRGRLGHGIGDLNNYYRFKLVEFFNNDSSGDDSPKKIFIKDVAISYNHTIVLTNNNTLYSWGLNDFNQLGFSSTYQNNLATKSKTAADTFEAEPREILYGDLRKNVHEIEGIAVSNIHSVAFTKNELYFWGLNIGQMGFEFSSEETIDHRVSNITYKGRIQSSPKVVYLRDEIKLVDACDTCTCVITKSNDIHVFFRSQHLKLSKIPIKSSTNKHFDIFQPINLTKAIGVEKLCLRSHDFIALLLDNGDIMSFTLPQDEIRNVKYNSIWKSYDIDMNVIDMDIGADGSIILCTRNGSVFMKSNHTKSRQNSITDSLVSVVKNKFRKVEHINKVVRVACDEKFLSFSVIRDEVDLLPLKLYTNDFLTDMQYLTILRDIESNRKQEELLDTFSNENTYVTDFIYNTKKDKVDIITWHENNDDEDENHEEDISESPVVDKLLASHSIRFSNNHKPLKQSHLYKPIRENSIKELVDDLKMSDDEILRRCTELSNSSHKNYDSYIEIVSFPGVRIGFHRAIFENRSKFCKSLFQTTKDEYFIDEGIEGKFDKSSNIFTFMTPIQPKSVLILIHYLYTNSILELWEDYPSGMNCPIDIKQIKTDFQKLVRVFKISDLYGNFSKDKAYIRQMNKILDSDCGDVKIKTSDGDIICHSWILRARSAYFETILSNRWENSEFTINFDFLSKSQVLVILRHLYGFPDQDLFNLMKYTYSEVDDFINELLELVEISDAFLLFDLKSICELSIKDLITIDNALVLLVHADNLSAKKLFLNCSWFIYNNLEILIFDSSFKDLQYDLLKSLEKNIIYFQNCKKKDFVKDEGKLNEGLMSNFFESKSNILVNDYLFDMNQFNDNFNSDRKGFSSFVPLIDFKYLQKPETKKKRDRKASRKSSTTPSDIMSFRNDIQPQEKQITESAVEDSNEDDFKMVSSRRKNIKGSVSIPCEKNDDSTRKASSNRSPSPLGSDDATPNNVSRNTANWSSTSLNSLNSTQPILSKAHSTGIGNSKKSNKIKFLAPTRLSQKERKKMVNSTSSPASDDIFNSQQTPWTKANSSSTSLNTIKSDFPVLRSSKNLDVDGNTSILSHTPSLTEIMIEESLRIEDAKVREEQKKTLQEIQQEQEFAKWWGQESQRVQKSLGDFSLGENDSAETNSKRSKRPKRSFSKPNKNNKTTKK